MIAVGPGCMTDMRLSIKIRCEQGKKRWLSPGVLPKFSNDYSDAAAYKLLTTHVKET